MVTVVKSWFKRNFTSPETTTLVLTFSFFVALFYFTGRMLTPVFISIVLAYLLDYLVERLEEKRVPHLLAVSLVCIFSIGVICVLLFWLLPLLWQQFLALINEVPALVKNGEKWLAELSQRYPQYLSLPQLKHYFGEFQSDFARMGKAVVSYSLASIPGIIELIIYAILVPLLVFFFLKDKNEMVAWFKPFAPKKRKLLASVWEEVDKQMGTYIRSKIIEVVIVAGAAFVTFALLGLNYAMLFSALVGLSVIIPYVGVIVVTVPLLLFAFMQWGLTMPFAYLLISYSIIMVVDGNILSPMLFSGTLNMHPIAVILAVIVFGGLWGFWGVFFAIPLAVLVKAIINSWP